MNNEASTSPPGVQTYRLTTVFMLCVAALFLVIIHPLEWLGWVVLGLVVLLMLSRINQSFSRDMLIVSGTIVVLGIVPIDTGVSFWHITSMAIYLFGIVIAAWAISKYWLKDHTIKFPLHHGRNWYKKEVFYILLTLTISYLLLPYYLGTTGSYLNWTAHLDFQFLLRLFIGMMGVGTWDELYFVGVCMALFRRHIPFFWANTFQAVIWTIFLYELGFRSWGPLIVFALALSQGYIFKNNRSLLYVLTIHLTMDLVLFLILIHLHNPDHLRIFITSPF